MKILHNHLGYRPAARKVALVQADAGTAPGTEFMLFDTLRREAVLQGPLQALGSSGWRSWQHWAADFSAVHQEGEFQLCVPGLAPPLVSHPFPIGPRVGDGQLLSDLLHYVKGQRCGGIFDAADRHCPVIDSPARVDVHGGWYDASGDASKYLSHLSYANFMNPQQTPQLVWNLIEGRSRIADPGVWMEDRLVDEALHGADFLLRMQHPDGYFHMTVFDRWSKDVAQRQICSYATQQGQLLARHQAGWRQGGGSTIAALARASGLPRDGVFVRESYLAGAERGFAHLERHNRAYLDDGCENIIDDYCALLAAAELWAATGTQRYRGAMLSRAERLSARQHEEGWFWADDARTRSFFHAADAGLPLVALLRAQNLLPDGSAEQAAVRETLARGLRHELRITQQAGPNPFGLPRQRVQMPGQPAQARFFMPHDNESGYWWQGENARLASLATAAIWARPLLAATDPAFDQGLRTYAQDALDWIFGRNPFDTCMMQGAGHHPPRYEAGLWNAPGGVCNGVTAGLDDEDDIDFRMPWETEPRHSWRWGEQWLPHAAWLFLALACHAEDTQR